MTSTIPAAGRGAEAGITTAEYSARLWSSAPLVDRDDRLTHLLDAALAATLDGDQHRAALAGWRRWRTLSTGQHVCPSYGPSFLAMDVIFTAALPPGDVPIVAACSGIPGSNHAHPLSLCFAGPLARAVVPGSPTWRLTESATAERRRRLGATEHRIRLASRRYHGALAFGTRWPPSLPGVLGDLQPALRASLADPGGEHYPTWALRTSARIQDAVLGRPVARIDINALVADYIAGVTYDRHHPIGRLFVDRVWRARWCAEMPDAPWFLAPTRGPRGAPRFETLRCEGDQLVGRHIRWPIEPGRIAELLVQRRLCPGLVLTYGVLVGVEGVRCLGGARQAAYLTRFERAWRALGLPVPRSLGLVDISGRIVDDRGAPIFPLDLALDGRVVAEVAPATTPIARLRAAGFHPDQEAPR